MSEGWDLYNSIEGLARSICGVNHVVGAFPSRDYALGWVRGEFRAVEVHGGARTDKMSNLHIGEVEVGGKTYWFAAYYDEEVDGFEMNVGYPSYTGGIDHMMRDGGREEPVKEVRSDK